MYMHTCIHVYLLYVCNDQRSSLPSCLSTYINPGRPVQLAAEIVQARVVTAAQAGDTEELTLW